MVLAVVGQIVGARASHQLELHGILCLLGATALDDLHSGIVTEQDVAVGFVARVGAYVGMSPGVGLQKKQNSNACSICF